MGDLPKRPYLLRALYDWIVDSGLTPYLLVGVASDAVHVPREFVSEGKIVLNISPMAVRDLLLEADSVSFSGRFSGRPFPVHVPMASVLAIYARESGEGMVFEPEYPDAGTGKEAGAAAPEAPAPEKDGEDPDPPRSGPPAGHLKVVK